MRCPIGRRDFLNGIALVVEASVGPQLAGAYAYTDGAIDQAWRAVQELTGASKG
jgi:hypothetical protein